MAEHLSRRRDEGFRGVVYEDTEGVPTIGYGRNLRSVGVSPDEAEFLFENDLRAAYNAARKLIPAFPYLDDERQGVLVNMMFNLGAARLATFRKMLAAIQRTDYAGWADEMRDSLWYRQVGERAKRLEARVRGRNDS